MLSCARTWGNGARLGVRRYHHPDHPPYRSSCEEMADRIGDSARVKLSWLSDSHPDDQTEAEENYDRAITKPLRRYRCPAMKRSLSLPTMERN